MLPMLKPKDQILIDLNAYQKHLPQVGDVVVAIHPENNQLTIVKRVSAIDGNGNYFLTGDNLNASTDSRNWGTVNLSCILGKVTNLFL